MKLSLVAALGPIGFVVACSGTSGGTVSNPSPTDPSPSGGGTSGSSNTPPDETSDAGADAAPPPKEAGASASVGNCASCTAGKCLPQLQACAGVQACVDALVAFNSCFQKQTDGTSGTCGASFASAGGSNAKALWACDEASCDSECGVP
jgi:hypothetical protein